VKTLTVDAHKRVRIPDSEPGQVYAYVNDGNGTLTLTKIEPIPAQSTPVRFEKRGKFTVGVSDAPVSMEALNKALSEFP